jgi:hypothetical protein
MEDQFTSEDLLPLVLSGHTYEREERGTLLLLNASILILVVSLVGMVILLSFGNPKKVFEDIEASLTDILALQPDTVHSTPTIQSTADAKVFHTKALPSTESGSPARVGIAADTAGQSQADISAAPPEALLKQFQGWAAKEDARAQIETVRPVQDARAKALRDAQARFVPSRKH